MCIRDRGDGAQGDGAAGGQGDGAQGDGAAGEGGQGDGAPGDDGAPDAETLEDESAQDGERAQEAEVEDAEEEEAEESAQGAEAEDSEAEEEDETVEDDGSWPIAIILIGVAVVLGAALLAYGIVAGLRRRQSDLTDDQLAHSLGVEKTKEPGVDYSGKVSALDWLLIELEQDTDPRHAIQRAYETIESGMLNPAWARRPNETPGMFLRRILGEEDQLVPPLQELTGLFEQARYSQHDITPDMRDRSVALVRYVREHYALRSTAQSDLLESHV